MQIQSNSAPTRVFSARFALNLKREAGSFFCGGGTRHD